MKWYWLPRYFCPALEIRHCSSGRMVLASNNPRNWYALKSNKNCNNKNNRQQPQTILKYSTSYLRITSAIVSNIFATRQTHLTSTLFYIHTHTNSIAFTVSNFIHFFFLFFFLNFSFKNKMTIRRLFCSSYPSDEGLLIIGIRIFNFIFLLLFAVRTLSRMKEK